MYREGNVCVFLSSCFKSCKNCNEIHKNRSRKITIENLFAWGGNPANVDNGVDAKGPATFIEPYILIAITHGTRGTLLRNVRRFAHASSTIW